MILSFQQDYSGCKKTDLEQSVLHYQKQVKYWQIFRERTQDFQMRLTADRQIESLNEHISKMLKFIAVP
jgi:hypothetical protein